MLWKINLKCSPKMKLHYVLFSPRNFVFILKNIPGRLYIDIIFIIKRIGDCNLMLIMPNSEFVTKGDIYMSAWPHLVQSKLPRAVVAFSFLFCTFIRWLIFFFRLTCASHLAWSSSKVVKWGAKVLTWRLKVDLEPLLSVNPNRGANEIL